MSVEEKMAAEESAVVEGPDHLNELKLGAVVQDCIDRLDYTAAAFSKIAGVLQNAGDSARAERYGLRALTLSNMTRVLYDETRKHPPTP